EDGIRDFHVTGVQTCALPICADGRQVGSVTAQLVAQETLLGDLRRVTVIGLVAAVLLSGCSAAITTAGSVLDRRRTFGALMAAGDRKSVGQGKGSGRGSGRGK